MGAPILDSDDTRPAELAAELELKPVPDKPRVKPSLAGFIAALIALGGFIAVLVFMGGAHG